jgi:hypothetical protein
MLVISLSHNPTLEIMRKKRFSAYMKILFLILFFLCLVQLLSAPTKDFTLRTLMIRNAMKYVENRHHELEFIRFINDLGRRESGNNWQCVNCIGCFGEWQFAESTVQFLGYKNVTLKKFKANPYIFPRELQWKVLESLIKVNLVLMKDYERFIGDTIKGVPITKSGMIAAAHLGGARSVKLFLTSEGRLDKKDILGTAVSNYMKRFGFYDID